MIYVAGVRQELNVPHENGVGVTRGTTQNSLPVAIMNPEDITIAFDSVDVNTDDLEALSASGNDFLSSLVTNGIQIQGSGGDIMEIVATSGGNAALVAADSVLDTQIVLASGSLTADVLSASIDVSSQLGFYNNAIMVGAGPSGSADVAIYASSDDTRYALVETLSAMASGAYLYYDLKGYETSIKLVPNVTQNYEVMLIRNR